jgi:hypothetical protein
VWYFVDHIEERIQIKMFEKQSAEENNITRDDYAMMSSKIFYSSHNNLGYPNQE